MSRKIQVFKEEPGFIKLFNLFKEKYRSLGKISGYVKLNTFDTTELVSIAGFMGQSPDRLLKKGRLALSEFEKELANTGFQDFTLLSLMEHVLDEKILTKKAEQEKLQYEELTFWQLLEEEIPEAGWWFKWIRSKTLDTRWIWSLYKENSEDLFNKIRSVFTSFTELPKDGTFERLPFFSQRTTGNPHYFDPGQDTGKLMIHCMAVDRYLKEPVNPDPFTIPRGTEDLNELLAEYGILRDDLWNFVTCQGLLATNGDGLHPVWEAAVHSNSVLNIPLKELVKVDRAWPAIGKTVWIVENSSVASMIMETLPDAPILCTHGQFRLASWRLIELLSESKCKFYYSGDLDPEGILIADRLKRRYKEQVVIWRMDQETYEKSVSDEDISNRLNKLDVITLPVWKDVINVIRKVKKAGYQEAIVSFLINDIKKAIE